MRASLPPSPSLSTSTPTAGSNEAAQPRFVCEPIPPPYSVCADGNTVGRTRVRLKQVCGCGMQPGGALARAGETATGMTHGFMVGAALSGQDAALLQTGVPAPEVEQALAPKLPGLIKTFEGIHANPELSEKEPNTAKLVADRLEALGYQVTRDFGQYADAKQPIHSAVAVLDNGPGPTLVIRADMDALPIQEETNVPYKSKNDGVMHACGHDAHTTILLGTAEMLVQMKDRWSGKLILVAQPSEEVGTGGRAMVQTGQLYEKFGKPDFALGLHTHAQHPAGTLRILPGFAMANADTIRVTLNGKGGHGAFPHLSANPLDMMFHFGVMTQLALARRTRPGEPGVLSFCKVGGGKAPNVIPGSVVLEGTVRSFIDDERAIIFDTVERAMKASALAVGAPTDNPSTFEHITNNSIPAVYNDPPLAERLKAIWKDHFDVGVMEQMMGADDFAYYSAGRTIPAVYFFVGSTDPELIKSGKFGLAHSSTFKVVPEPTIKTGVMAMVTAATSLLAKDAKTA